MAFQRYLLMLGMRFGNDNEEQETGMGHSLAQLPPLDLVKGFVAVARRLSFTRAAADLCVTQSAVSRQIGTLEEYLGVHLIVRHHRSIELTEEGKRLFRAADGWLEQLGGVTAALRSRPERSQVTITASIGVASLWLLPRLGAFQSANPNVDVRVAANNTVLNLEREDIDLSIRYCPASAVSGEALRLFGETVAHPSLKAGKDLRAFFSKQVFLELGDPNRPWLRWGDWLTAAGMSGVKPRGVLTSINMIR